MRTAIVSDLHLGVGTSSDLLRSERVREGLAPELEAADRVVLLGDVVELRDRPLTAVLATARPAFEWLGGLAGDGELVLLPGNHDHHLVAPWIERRLFDGSGALGLEQLVEPLDGPLRMLADAARPARLTVAYPGLWIRPDVYAIHGHYLDRHLTIPTLERLGVAVVERLLGVEPSAPGAPAPTDAPAGDAMAYERVQTPVYEFLFALAQAASAEGPGSAGPSIRVWEMLTGKDTRAARIRGWLLGSVALPGAVGVANRLGLGPVRSDLSPRAITEAGLEAMRALVDQLRIEAEHVIFGHTHRRGPLPGDSGWTAGRTRLWNTGSWVFSPSLVGESGSKSPYWPGTIAVVNDAGPPALAHLLDGWSRDELAGAAT